MVQEALSWNWWVALSQEEQAGVVAFAGVVTCASYLATKAILGKLAMRKREKERRRFEKMLRDLIETGEFGKAIEDKLVCEIQMKIASGQLSTDEARMVYAHYARLGLWGLHPRKLNIKRTGLDMTELKERLMERAAQRGIGKWPQRWRAYIGHTVHTEHGSTTVVRMLDGVKL